MELRLALVVALASLACRAPQRPRPTPAVAAQPTVAAQPVAASLSAPIRGSLARGDRNLASGEFVDAHTVTLPQGVGVQIRLSSTDFDPYLIVRSPSGRQVDNDDLTKLIICM